MSLDPQGNNASGAGAENDDYSPMPVGAPLQYAVNLHQTLVHPSGTSQLLGNYGSVPTPAFFYPTIDQRSPLSSALPLSIHNQATGESNPFVPATSLLAEQQPPITEAAIPVSTSTKRYCRILYLAQDDENLSPYQCLVRKQIELFEATDQYLPDKSQGRNRPIVLNQIGIRCRHCGMLPAKERAKGAVFFPSQLDGLYQTAQNLANKHLLHDCREMPTDVREDLVSVRLKEKGVKTRKSAYGGGRHYWADGLRVLGVVQTQDRRLCLTSAVSGK
jgi:hypothetical protein